MEDVERTTINISKKLVEKLKGRKKYKRETYDEVLERMLNKEMGK